MLSKKKDPNYKNLNNENIQIQDVLKHSNAIRICPVVEWWFKYQPFGVPPLFNHTNTRHLKSTVKKFDGNFTLLADLMNNTQK